MTKKRHWPVYSKPQSTAPHSLESSGLQSNLHHDEPQSRNVNDILANLRRMDLSSGSGPGGASNSTISSSPALGALIPVPSVPPELAHLFPSPPNGGGFGVPTPAPAVDPRGGGVGTTRGVGTGAGGARRRGPAGPAPPPSWQAQSHATRREAFEHNYQRHGLSAHPRHAGREMPGLVWPDRNSLMDLCMRRFISTWEEQKEQHKDYLIYDPGRLRALMVSYLGQRTELFNTPGATIKDLRSLLTHPSPPTSQADSPAGSPTGRPGCHVTSDSEAKSGVDDDAQMEQEDEEELPSSSTLNEDFHYLDLTWSMGRSISVREVSDLLFPRQPARARSANASGVGWKDTDVLESWDAPEGLLSPPRPLLPNLTHLSLALFPSSDKAPAVSWRHLLSFAKNLPMLTHLSLAYWPEPTLTPNAKLATVTSPMGQRLQYGGTGAYSHSLDNDWAEAVLLMRKLSKALYGLEYLDLTGCASWLPALMRKVDNGQVDWVGDWGKITKLVLNYGVSTDVPAPEEAQQTTGSATVSGSEMIRQINATSEARLIEAYIRQQRAGRGRFITVVYDRRDTAGSNVS